MKLNLKTKMDCSANRMFESVKRTSNFFEITKPLVKFVPQQFLGEQWEEKEYLMEMYLFGVIPLGRQTIDIRYEQGKKRMRDNGRSNRIKKWDHIISICDSGEHQCIYTDEINIEAGLITFFVFLFAHVFFRYRQLKWKRIIAFENRMGRTEN